jgi:hypothetical protein
LSNGRGYPERIVSAMCRCSPQFDEVLLTRNSSSLEECCGSSQRLLSELIEVAPALGIKLDRRGELADDEATRISELAEAEQTPYYRELLSWMALYEAARLSIQHRTAIVFQQRGSVTVGIGSLKADLWRLRRDGAVGHVIACRSGLVARMALPCRQKARRDVDRQINGRACRHWLPQPVDALADLQPRALCLICGVRHA